MIRHLSPLPCRPGGGVWPTSAIGSAWSPAIAANRLMWLRGDVTTASASRVSSWTDQSGAGNPATSVGAVGTRPLATTWAAGNNQLALYFDGTRSLATAGNVLPTADGAGFTIFTVGSFDDTTFRVPLLTNGSLGGIALSQNGGGTGKLQRWKLGVTFDDDGNAVTTPLNVIMVDQVGAAPASEFYVNGSLVSTTVPNGQVITPSGKLYLGASATTNFFKGYLAEVLIISGRASQSVRDLWNAYSLARYGV